MHSNVLLSPFILLLNLGFLLLGKVVYNIKSLANLFRGLALDESGNFGTAQIQKTFDIQVVGSHDDFEDLFKILDVYVLGVEFTDHFREIAGLQGLLNFLRFVLLVVFTVLNYLLETRTAHIRKGYFVLRPTVFLIYNYLQSCSL